MENLTEQKCIVPDWQEMRDGAKYVSPDDCRCQKCYKLHGELMYEIGLGSAFQSVLNYETDWSVRMNGKRWNLDTVVIESDGPITLIIEGIDIDTSAEWRISTKAKNGTVGELWKVIERAYKRAKKQHNDWHRYIEQFDPVGIDTYEVFMGS